MIISQKNAIVTGASRGLGAALASALIAKGAKVYGLARNAQALKALQEKMGRRIQEFEQRHRAGGRKVGIHASQTTPGNLTRQRQ